MWIRYKVFTQTWLNSHQRFNQKRKNKRKGKLFGCGVEYNVWPTYT